MTDIAGVSREQALDTLEWTARTLVEAVFQERPPDRSHATRREKTGGKSSTRPSA
jgi:hypothetical protein